MHSYASTFMNYGICMASIQNIGPLVRIYNTRLHKKIWNEERAHLEVHYQKELRHINNNMA
jgi:hypothetical protein